MQKKLFLGALLASAWTLGTACGSDTPAKPSQLANLFPINTGDGTDSGLPGPDSGSYVPPSGDGDNTYVPPSGDGDNTYVPPSGDGDSGASIGDGDSGVSAGDGSVSTGDGDSSGGGFIREPDPTRDSGSKNGMYTVQSYTSGYRDGPNFADGTIWYPSDANAPFAAVAIVPGWVSSQGDISHWGPFLASHGIVAITIGTNSPATDMPADREAALMDALVSLEDENDRTASPLYGKLDKSRQGVIGWSMGGGGALLAASDHPDLKVAISLCGWNPGHSYSNDTVPSLLFAGTADVLTGPTAGSQAQAFYTSIPNSTPKEIYEVNGGDHWVANDPAHENGQIGLYGLSWLKVFLEDDARYKQFLTEKPDNSSDFRNNL